MVELKMPDYSLSIIGSWLESQRDQFQHPQCRDLLWCEHNPKPDSIKLPDDLPEEPIQITTKTIAVPIHDIDPSTIDPEALKRVGDLFGKR